MIYHIDFLTINKCMEIVKSVKNTKGCIIIYVYIVLFYVN